MATVDRLIETPLTLTEADAQPGAPLRFVTAASLFDGHDASINIIRRILQSRGVEVIHLGHNRSVSEVVNTALQEDAHGIALSSYQGGHVEYLKYMLDLLAQNDGGEIRVFAGGGGVIIPEEKALLEACGVTRIYTPEDGQRMGLDGIVEHMIETTVTHLRHAPSAVAPLSPEALEKGDLRALSRALSATQDGAVGKRLRAAIKRGRQRDGKIPVLGITGAGGAGKSSLTDELILRFRLDLADSLKIAILAVDPTRRRTGGALLGDRIRMNAVNHPNIFMRSVATRDSVSEVPDCVGSMIALCKAAGFDLVIVETPGIGQGDTAISPLVDCALYVMTPEFGAQSQLEKIGMLDFADIVAINKFDRRGADDAWRDVAKQVQRNREAFGARLEDMPVFGAIASRFNDDGVTALYQEILARLRKHGLKDERSRLPRIDTRVSTDRNRIIPEGRQRYLADIAGVIRDYRQRAAEQAHLARQLQQLKASRSMLREQVGDGAVAETVALERLIEERSTRLDPQLGSALQRWPEERQQLSGDEYVVTIRERRIRNRLKKKTLSGTDIPRVALPKFEDQGELARWMMLDNLPGRFPFTAGVFPFKRDGEDPTRMFAGGGDAFNTNRRFRDLSEHSSAKRLSTAFDSVTLYGCDPDERPDIYGKVGNSGVSIATLEDMRALYDGFDLCDPATSVSMTINGPAPIILAMFLNVAIDQRQQAFIKREGRSPDTRQASLLRAEALASVRGTVQADILKEDQGQNTCIFSTEFSLRLMGDVQQYFIRHHIRNFYSVSISGYHIAEAGANPVTQLAFTLANGFTYVEAWLARGMEIDDFASNLSFFFSNGMCPEYTVMGRVARRIWAVAMRDRYGAQTRSQKLKYHIQTSGRSLHAQEIDFNDIRTTLQALIAVYDNCNSLHTNAFDEAITTPTDESVRRALAIQLIINREWGLAMNENPNQGSFIIEELTDLVEEAVLSEFERISQRGGVLGAMETGYQRGRIQDQSMEYEHRKHEGSLPVIGVNTFVNPAPKPQGASIELSRSTEQEKRNQIKRLLQFKADHRDTSRDALQAIKQAAIDNRNIFEQLMHAARTCSLGEISEALYEVGGQYRRNM